MTVVSSSGQKSSTPVSIMFSSSSSKSVPAGTRNLNEHLCSNMKATLPDVPNAPPHLLKYMRMLATVRLVLSVAVSTRKAMP